MQQLFAIVGENYNNFIIAMKNLQKNLLSKTSYTRKLQIKEAESKTNYPTFLRLYISTTKNFSNEVVLHFDDSDKNDRSNFSRFLNIVVNSDINFEVFSEKAKMLYKEYITLRLESSTEYALGKSDLTVYELENIKIYQAIIDKAKSDL